MSRQIQPINIVGATRWLKLRAWGSKGADAETATGGLAVVRRAENRGNLGNAIP